MPTRSAERALEGNMAPHLLRVRLGGGVAGGGDAEEVEDLLLEGVEFGLEGLQVLATGVQLVAGEVGEDRKDAFGRGGGAGA